MRTTRNMDMDNSIGRVEIITLENTATTKGMVMERCIGQMEVFIRVTGNKECSTALVKITLTDGRVQKGKFENNQFIEVVKDNTKKPEPLQDL